MLKKKIIWIMLVVALFGCTKGGSGSGIGSGIGRTFTDVEKVEDWLANQKGGASPDDPIPFSVRLNLQNMAAPESNWHKLLTSINTAGLYVALDLSGCTMPGTEFTADGGIEAGKKFIVSLVLPDSTESVAGVLYGYFENLKTAKARNIEYLIGNPGPAGGIVFYDKGNSSGGWRYLEAAPAETEFWAEWGAYGQYVSGTETGIGTGKRNTELIAAYLNSLGETGRAAQVCANLSVNGFSGWFLPSIDELDLMYQNLQRNSIGGFTSAWYWSSSLNGNYGYSGAWTQLFGLGSRLLNYDAWDRHFGNGSRLLNYSKHYEYAVRAVRAF